MVECVKGSIVDIIVSLQCFDSWLGVRKGIQPVKNWVLVC